MEIDRIEPPCPYFGKCGGCQWQHISYETQLEWKQKTLEETLWRTAKIENPHVLPTIPSPKTFGWRSRVTLHGDQKGNIGFFAPNTHKVVDIERCLIVEDSVNEQLAQLRQNKNYLKKDYEVRSTNEKGFTQVNPLQNENLKGLLKEWALKLPHDTIVELFCGSGNFTEVLIPMAKKIVAIDCDRESIEQAQKSFPAVEFICTDGVRYFAKFKPEEPLDLLVLDPPRDGAGGVVEGVIKTKPKNILYISCNPDTLARDLKYLKDFAGYTLVQTQPIDMFPMSHHIESLSLVSGDK
ncbi:MAG: hypothetical protein A2W61_07490 [Deltaproteobacteria bacterium RIFCSPLOWO2_01_44_7]|nr:MAG: hypothetical protein A2712_08610 [Deltaproteobacteria bacterium RIFCSPHIGHO2_01_FULL_43_49]OGQ14601.1 MAG: hypothetical protein A3D22_08390 [Deltaproteobacteria bacterium RIFCSPHIGHO2_02_FULL_44_53]OGQ27987.1 MAG: hypothetical protein A3D98_07100 [Deltaproteobacteria bacterium RIFCSPHIGHO2_12_FULL_44_21]OGQ31199.1 MAG: hypothetical protein A2979_07150 [Deltaproteobacteria bacterium RIFCSPLOWO2_01_FULL_45_74]OGQ37973.1 MAG: hypothetical protein A2W61_07490 [Deltaproteobacteria bacterium 